MTGLFRPVGSLPLDCADRLGCENEKHTVDALYLVSDMIGEVMENRIGDRLNFRENQGEVLVHMSRTSPYLERSIPWQPLIF